MSTLTIDEKMTKYPYITDKKMTAAAAANFMHECNIRHLPVVENDELVGVVDESKLKVAKAFQGPGTLLVEDIMDTSPFSVEESAPIASVIRTMIDTKHNYALAVNGKRNVVGIFTTTNAMNMLLESLYDAQNKNLLKSYYETWRKNE